MQKHTSQQPDDIKGEITSVVEDIMEARVENDQGLVSELTDKLIALMDKHEDKYELYASTIKRSAAGAEERKEKIRSDRAKVTALTKLEEQLRQRLKDDMKQHNLNVVNAGFFTIRVRKDDMPTVIVNIPAEQLPERFQRRKVEPDKPKLKSAIIDGEEIEGVHLELGDHIEIFSF